MCYFCHNIEVVLREKSVKCCVSMFDRVSKVHLMNNE